MSEYLVQYGEIIAYVLGGVIAFVGLGLVQLIRRKRDVKRARVAVRLASYSISEPRVGPIAVAGSYHAQGEWLDCRGQRVTFDGNVEVVSGTRGHWRGGARTYEVRDGDEVIAIGVMSKLDDGWRLVPSRGEAGIQLFARDPRPAPRPLWPWRAPLILAVCGGIAFGGLYQIGTLVVDTHDCTEGAQSQLQLASALPLVRDEALAKLARCRKLAP